jgi:hypothetical protein
VYVGSDDGKLYAFSLLADSDAPRPGPATRRPARARKLSGRKPRGRG